MTSNIFSLPALPYSLNALEPIISSRTVDLHYNKHHQAYLNNLNDALQKKGWVTDNLESIIMQTFKQPGELGIFNNAGQVWNHNFYWNSIIPSGGNIPSGALFRQIENDFQNYANFRQEFIQQGVSQFGSGWVWLVWDKKTEKLLVTKTSNADSPMLYNQKALITSDVWEHAYYLDYQNRRANYLELFVDKLINWEFAEQNFKAII